jgi:hypothetical protein
MVVDESSNATVRTVRLHENGEGYNQKSWTGG